MEGALRSIAPAGVTTGVRYIDAGDVVRLSPGEAAAVAGAMLTRRREFATGRVLLRTLIGTVQPILVGADRAPVLPCGVAASLAHDRLVAVAAVTRIPGLVLGIDIEPTTPLTADVAAIVLRPDEANVDAHLAFTLKEAAYKAWSRCGGRLLDHHEVRLTVAASEFTAEVLGEGMRIDGRYVRSDGRWIALAAASRAYSLGPSSDLTMGLLS